MEPRTICTKSVGLFEIDGETVGCEDSAGNEFEGIRLVHNGVNDPPEDRSNHVHTDIWLDAELWRDMGEPSVITVTFQPGDILND